MTGEEIVGKTNVLSGIKAVIENRHASGRVRVRWKNQSQVVRTLTIEPASSANALENATEVIVTPKSEAGHNFVITNRT